MSAQGRDPVPPRNAFGYWDLTPSQAWWGLPGRCRGLRSWEEEVRKREVLKLAAEKLGVAEETLDGCWASWSQPAVGLIPKCDVRVGDAHGTYGKYSDRHVLRLLVGYKLAGRGHRFEISVPSLDAHRRGQLVVERLQEEAARRHPELTREQGLVRLLREEPHLYENYLNELKEGRWRFTIRPGLLAKLIEALEHYSVGDVFRNQTPDGRPLVPLRVPVEVWGEFIRQFALTLAEIETGIRYDGTVIEEDDIEAWSATDDRAPPWRLRESKIF